MLVLKYKEAKRRIEAKTKANTSTKIENLKLHRQLYSDIQNLHLDSVVVKKVNFQNRLIDENTNNNFIANGNNAKNLSPNKINSNTNKSNPYHNPAFNQGQHNSVNKVNERSTMRHSSVKERFFSANKRPNPLNSINVKKYSNEVEKELLITDNNNQITIEKEKESFLPIIVEKRKNGNHNNINIERVHGDRFQFKQLNKKDNIMELFDMKETKNKENVDEKEKENHNKNRERDKESKEVYNNLIYSSQNSRANYLIQQGKGEEKGNNLQEKNRFRERERDKENRESKEFYSNMLHSSQNSHTNYINPNKIRSQNSCSPNVLKQHDNNKKMDNQMEIKKDKFKSDMNMKVVSNDKIEEDKRKRKSIASPGIKKVILNKSPPIGKDGKIQKGGIEVQRLRERSISKDPFKTNKNFQVKL